MADLKGPWLRCIPLRKRPKIPIRTAYGHFIAVSDVVLQMVQALKLQRRDFADVMHTFL